MSWYTRKKTQRCVGKRRTLLRSRLSFAPLSHLLNKPLPSRPHARTHAGLGHGTYPFGSAGLDLLLLGLLRPLVAAAGCLSFFLLLRRSNLRRVENGAGRGEPTHPHTTNLRSCNGNGYTLRSSAMMHNNGGADGGATSRVWQDQGGKHGVGAEDADNGRGCCEDDFPEVRTSVWSIQCSVSDKLKNQRIDFTL